MAYLVGTNLPVPRAPRAARRRNEGFIPVEVTFLLVIFGVIVAVFAPRLDFGPAGAEGASHQLNALAMEAQRRAVHEGHDVRLIFDFVAGAVRLHDDADNDGTAGADESVAHVKLPEGTTMALAGEPPVLTFHGNGSATQEGIVYLTVLPEIDSTGARLADVPDPAWTTTCWSYREGGWRQGC